MSSLVLLSQSSDSSSAMVDSSLVQTIFSSQEFLSSADALVVLVSQLAHILSLSLVLSDLVSDVVNSSAGSLSLAIHVLPLVDSSLVVRSGTVVSVSVLVNQLVVVRSSLLVELGVSSLGASFGLLH